MNTQLELISNARHRLDMYMDHTQPHLTVESRQLRQGFLDNKSKGIKSRYLTEIQICSRPETLSGMCNIYRMERCAMSMLRPCTKNKAEALWS